MGELGSAWLERKRGHMKPSAYRSYENAWRVHVEPRWRAAKVGDIRHTGVQAWIAELSSKGLSASRVITIYSVLAGILDDAMRDRMLAANPARGVSLPRRTRRPNVYLTAEQLRMLTVESGRYGSLILLLGVAGLRWGEAAALRVRDVNFLRRRVLLHENAVAVGGRTHVGTLKSGHSRTVSLPEFVVDELASTCEGKERDELIWPAQDGGYLAPADEQIVVGRCGPAVPGGRQNIPARDSARAAAHRGFASDRVGRESQGGATDARARLGGHDSRRLCRSFRLRLHCSCRQVI